MAADPYATLGVQRGANEKDDQVRLSQARQGAASRPQQGQSQGRRALLRSDHAPTTCCPTRTSAPASTAARSTPTATRRCRSAAVRRRRFDGFRRGAGGPARAAFPPATSRASAARRDLSDLFEGLFGGRDGGTRGAGPGGVRPAAARPRRRSAAPMSPTASRCRSPTPPRSSRSGSRLPTARRSTSSCPPGSRTARRCASRARASRARAATATRW